MFTQCIDWKQFRQMRKHKHDFLSMRIKLYSATQKLLIKFWATLHKLHHFDEGFLNYFYLALSVFDILRYTTVILSKNLTEAFNKTLNCHRNLKITVYGIQFFFEYMILRQMGENYAVKQG